jgi:hypothetical protein
MCEVLLRLLPESGIPDFELLLALGALDESKAAGLLNDYLLENKEGNLCLKWIQTMNDSQLHGNRRSLLSISETLLKAAVFCEVDKKVWQLLYENAMLFPARTSFEILQNLSDGNLENAFLLELLETRLSRSCVDLTAIEGVSRFSDQTRRLFYLFLRDPLLQTRGELPSQHFEWSLYAPSNYQLLLEHHSGEGRFAMTPSKASLLLDHLNSSEMPEISGESLGLCYYYLLENGLLEREHLRRLFSRKENNTDVDIYLK